MSNDYLLVYRPGHAEGVIKILYSRLLFMAIKQIPEIFPHSNKEIYRVVLHQKIFTGRAGCREQFEVGYSCPEMNSNAAMGTFLRKLGNAATQAIPLSLIHI